MGTAVSGLITSSEANIVGRLSRQIIAASRPNSRCAGSGMNEMAMAAPNAVVMPRRFIDHRRESVSRGPSSRKYQLPRNLAAAGRNLTNSRRGMVWRILAGLASGNRQPAGPSSNDGERRRCAACCCSVVCCWRCGRLRPSSSRCCGCWLRRCHCCCAGQACASGCCWWPDSCKRNRSHVPCRHRLSPVPSAS